MRKHLVPMLLLAAAGCDNGGSSSSNLLGGVQAIAYIQRTVGDTGNVFDYTGGGKDGNLFTLTPPTASGVKKNLTNWKGGDVTSFDLRFDAKEIVFSGRAPGEDHYHLFRIGVDGSNPCDAEKGKVSEGPCQITDGPNDEVYPIYLPAGRIFYVTNKNVEGPSVPQFRDEYERATTAQAGTIMADGSDPQLGPRNVSHRVFPNLLSDGRIILTEWRHLGDVNEGDLTILSQDMTGAREAFGREGKGLENNYLRAKELAPGKLIAIGASRDRTFQAGKLLMIDLGGANVDAQSEAKSSAVDLTPEIPGGRSPSYMGIGRYYDVSPVPDTAKGGMKADQFLVSWSDGAVQTETLAMAKSAPDFGIYLYDAKAKTRFPIVNELGSWEYGATPIVKRPEPMALKNQFTVDNTQSTLLAAINVYDSSLFSGVNKGDIKKARIVEGFSSEEGFPNMFGMSDFDGMARLGDADVGPDGSFKALIPANTPVRLQMLDKYGMAIGAQGGNMTEPLWIQGRPGEARVCGGCHEDRTKPIQIAPGSSLLQATGAAAFDFAGKSRLERKSMEFTEAKVVGVPWDKALQPIFDAKCVACHDGSPGAANPSYSITDLRTMETFAHTFSLKGDFEMINVGMKMYNLSASYISLLGPEMATREAQVMVTGTPKSYVAAGSARDSEMLKLLNPPARYPNLDLNDRAFGAKPQHPKGISYNGIDGNDPKFELTADEYYLLILMADNGGQFYSRENAPGGY